MKITLDFGLFTMKATLFDTPVAKSLFASLPQTVVLTKWGRELYGSVTGSHGSHKTVSDIPVGGLAYTERGSYFCIFYGQSPAWPVDYVGQLEGDAVELLSTATIRQVILQRES